MAPRSVSLMPMWMPTASRGAATFLVFLAMCSLLGCARSSLWTAGRDGQSFGVIAAIGCSDSGGQPLHPGQLARVDRVAQGRDRLVAREGAPPRQHDAP